jgi:hypothetical protein
MARSYVLVRGANAMSLLENERWSDLSRHQPKLELISSRAVLGFLLTLAWLGVEISVRDVAAISGRHQRNRPPMDHAARVRLL